VVQGAIRDDDAVRSVQSPSHALDTVREEAGLVRFTAEGDLQSQKGFTLYYAAGTDTRTGLNLLTYRPEGADGYFLLTVSPGTSGQRRLPRDIVFALDVSGSMQSDGKLQQAVAALHYGLETLSPEDRFAIVTYSSTARSWRDGLTWAESKAVGEAGLYIDGLSAAGGTNMEDALTRVAGFTRLNQEDSDDIEPRPVYVVLLTDGRPTVAETHPDFLIQKAGVELTSEVRLFTWGVGYDVNTYLLDQLARLHNGLSEYVEPFDDLELRVSAFFSKISSPLLTDLELSVGGIQTYDLFPARLPDLFRDSPMTILGRYRGSGPADLMLKGKENGGFNTIERPVSFPEKETETAFLASMWAQRRVGYLLEQIRLNGHNRELREEVISLGERYGLITPYTGYLVTEDDLVRNSPASGAAGSGIHFRRSRPPAVQLPAGTATIRGHVIQTDSGEPLAAVNVMVLQADGSATNSGAFTNADGDYVIINLPSGRYTLRAAMMGFATVEVPDVEVVDGQVTEQSFQLETMVLDAGNVVTITADRDIIQRDVAATQQSYTIEEMERMAVSSTADILRLQTNTFTLDSFKDDIPGYYDRALEQLHMRGGRNAEVAFMIDSLGVAGIAGDRFQTGKTAVQMSNLEQALQESLTEGDDEGLTVKRVKEKTFRLDEESRTWRDEKVTEEMEVKEIEVGGETFLELLEEYEDLGRYAALGKKVEVLLGKQAYRLILPDSR
jgi:uncharacterized protein YegL